jgi:hypothetical protein
MEKFVTVTVDGTPHILAFNDELHNVKYGSTNNGPTTIELIGNDYRVLETLVVDESHQEVERLLREAKRLTAHFLAVVTPPTNCVFDHDGFTSKMEVLGFMPSAVASQGGRVELPQGVYVFDGTRNSTSHISYTLEEAKREVQDALESSITNPRFPEDSSGRKATVLLADARNVAWW